MLFIDFNFAISEVLWQSLSMKVKVEHLKPHPKNSEIYSLSNIEELSNSISEMGLLEKIVIDDSFQVISGHRRLESIKKLGWKEVDCEQIELSEDETIKRIIHHNKQRIKTNRELLNEVKVLIDEYKIGQGKRTDITSVSPNQSLRTRDIVSEMIGISGGMIARLLFIEKENPELIDLIDKGILTVNQAYLQTSRIKKENDSRLENRKSNPPGLNDFTFHNKSSESMKELKDNEVDFTNQSYAQLGNRCGNGWDVNLVGKIFNKIFKQAKLKS